MKSTIIARRLEFLKAMSILSVLFMGSGGFSQGAAAKNAETPFRINYDLKFYLPSVMGIVCGRNPSLGSSSDIESVDGCLNIMAEGRGEIASFRSVAFSWGLGIGTYVENSEGGDDLSSANLSIGTGIYFHIFENPAAHSLNGLCVYLYPAYQIPLDLPKGYGPYLKWKSALDIGYNLTLFECVSVYAYTRYMMGWHSQDARRYGFDFGLAVGIYFGENI